MEKVQLRRGSRFESERRHQYWPGWLELGDTADSKPAAERRGGSTPLPGTRTIRPVRLTAQDAGFSIRQCGFDSRTGYHVLAPSTKSRSRVFQARGASANLAGATRNITEALGSRRPPSLEARR